jgi:hypothetical protein
MRHNSFVELLYLISPIILIWLILHLYFRFTGRSQPSPPLTARQQIIRAAFRVFFFIWFTLCGLAAVFGLGFLFAVGMANGGGRVSLSNDEQIYLKLIAIPMVMGAIASFAASSKKSVALWGCAAYGLYAVGLLFLTFFDSGQLSLRNIGAVFGGAGILTLFLAPVHFGWLGLMFLFRQVPPPKS